MKTEIHPGMGIRCVYPRLEKTPPPTDWPDKWHTWPVVRRALHTMADGFLAALKRYQGPETGRGVVIAGGGNYLPGVWVAIQMLRQVGSTLPVEVWHLGAVEMPGVWYDLLTALPGVRVIDALAYGIDHDDSMRVPGGWPLKLYAVLHSAFREVLFLDADCYPVTNPEILFDQARYQETGAIWYPNDPIMDRRTNWEAWGVNPNGHPFHVETGVFVLDRKIAHEPAQLARFYNEHSDLTYSWDYGDCGPCRVAWAKLRRSFAHYGTPAPVVVHSFVHNGPDGIPLFVHRTQDKPRLWPTLFNQQQFHVIQNPVRSLPGETEFLNVLGELRMRVDRCQDLETTLRFDARRSHSL